MATADRWTAALLARIPGITAVRMGREKWLEFSGEPDTKRFAEALERILRCTDDHEAERVAREALKKVRTPKKPTVQP